MKRNAHEAAGIAARVATLAAALCVAGCAWATALDDIPGDTDIYTAAQTDAAIAAATGAIHVAEADLTPSNAVLVATIKEVAPAPGDYETVSNKAMNSVQSSKGIMTGDLTFTGGQNGANAKLHSDNGTLSIIGTDPAGSINGYSFSPSSIDAVAKKSDIPDLSGFATTEYADSAAASAASAAMNDSISTNNAAFVSAVLAVPLAGADANDLAELSEYGSYGTVGAAILALIAGLAALKRRMGTAETTISGKLDGAAAYPAWVEGDAYTVDDIVSHKGRIWKSLVTNFEEPGTDPLKWVEVYLKDLKQDALSQSQRAAVNSGATAAKVATWDGYAEQIAAKANATDLPYAMVTPGEWKVISNETQRQFLYCSWDTEVRMWVLSLAGAPEGYYASGTPADLTVSFDVYGDSVVVERPSLPGHLLDRANNLVSVSANTTLTLPPFEAGKVRDLLVACTIGVDANDEPWSVIFQGGDGEEISFKAEGDDAASATFPVPDAAGDWWYSLTERAPHVFAVSLKQLQSVSQPTQTQGGE